MTKQIRVISDSDWEVLKRVVAANQNLQQTPANRPTDNSQFRDGDDSMSPEVYIALPPSGGIPALTYADVSGSGTATGSPGTGDAPGSAVCSIFRISNDLLVPVPGLIRRVYNLSSTEITDSWVTVYRTKFGAWVCGVSGGGGCASQNTKIQWTVNGSPTGGTFTSLLEIEGSEELVTFSYNNDTTAFGTALATHTQLSSSDFIVRGGPFPNATMEVEFIGPQANTLIALPISNWGSLTGGSGRSIITSYSQLGHA